MKHKLFALIFIISSCFLLLNQPAHATIKPGLPKFYINDSEFTEPIRVINQQLYIKSTSMKVLGANVVQTSDLEAKIITNQKDLVLDFASGIAGVYQSNHTAFYPDTYTVLNFEKSGNDLWLNVKDLAPYLGYQYQRIKNVDLFRLTDGSQTITEEALYEISTVLPVSTTDKTTDGKKYAPDKANKPAPKKVVYLTFDDGPNQYTKDILALLDKYDQKATFFMLYNGIVKYPDLAKTIMKSEHGLGLHGVTHRKNLFYKDANSPTKEMSTDQAALKKATGYTTHLVRTPYGSKPYLSKTQYQTLTKAGFILWDWNVDSGDSSKAYVDPKVIETRVLTGLKAKTVPVVLMHDKQCTLDALENILKWMKANGYESRPLTEEMEPLNWSK